MSNNNAYWGKWYGYKHPDGSNALVVRQLSSGQSISGPHQIAPAPNSPRAHQAKRDRETFARNGMPTIIHKFNLKAISG